jgi:hypothetical protein
MTRVSGLHGTDRDRVFRQNQNFRDPAANLLSKRGSIELSFVFKVKINHEMVRFASIADTKTNCKADLKRIAKAAY